MSSLISLRIHAVLIAVILDNNDGISVLDVTDPERPSYCFLMTWHPLDARGYLNCYYDVPEEVSKKAVQQGATGSIVSGEAKTSESYPVPKE